jgi:hypothetical protein
MIAPHMINIESGLAGLFVNGSFTRLTADMNGLDGACRF